MQFVCHALVIALCLPLGLVARRYRLVRWVLAVGVVDRLLLSDLGAAGLCFVDDRVDEAEVEELLDDRRVQDLLELDHALAVGALLDALDGLVADVLELEEVLDRRVANIGVDVALVLWQLQFLGNRLARDLEVAAFRALATLLLERDTQGDPCVDKKYQN